MMFGGKTAGLPKVTQAASGLAPTQQITVPLGRGQASKSPAARNPPPALNFDEANNVVVSTGLQSQQADREDSQRGSPRPHSRLAAEAEPSGPTTKASGMFNYPQEHDELHSGFDNGSIPITGSLPVTDQTITTEE